MVDFWPPAFKMRVCIVGVSLSLVLFVGCGGRASQYGGSDGSERADGNDPADPELEECASGAPDQDGDGVADACDVCTGFDDHDLRVVADDVRIETQSDLAEFAGVGEVTGALTIAEPGSGAISAVHCLGCLQSVGDHIPVANDAALTSLRGLDNLTSVGGGVGIYGNAKLASLSALENLTDVSGYFSVLGNSALSNLTGLEGITVVPGRLEIARNVALTSLTGLENLASVGSTIDIYDNIALTSVTAFENITSVGGDLILRGNISLSQCTIDDLVDDWQERG